MDREKEERLQRELLEGETIEWCGEPKPGAVFCAWDIFMIPFSLLWCGFAVFWETTAITAGAPIFFGVFGSFFVVIGLYIVFGRFIVKYVQNKNTAYAVTNRRMLITGRRSVSSLEFKDVPTIRKTRRKDGSGTLSFETSKSLWYWNAGAEMWGFGRHIPLRFLTIGNVDDVYRLVTEKVRAAKNLP